MPCGVRNLSFFTVFFQGRGPWRSILQASWRFNASINTRGHDCRSPSAGKVLEHWGPKNLTGTASPWRPLATSSPQYYRQVPFGSPSLSLARIYGLYLCELDSRFFFVFPLSLSPLFGLPGPSWLWVSDPRVCDTVKTRMGGQARNRPTELGSQGSQLPRQGLTTDYYLVGVFVVICGSSVVVVI